MPITPLSPRHVAPGAGQTLRVLGNLVTFKAMAADSGGAYALFETRTAPGQGMPLHRQYYDDEAFLVVDGTYAVQIGHQTMELQAGEHAFVPRGTLHAFTNIGTAPARMLIMVSPGGIHEQFLAEVGEPITDPAAPLAATSPAIAKVMAVAPKYGIEFVPPMAR